LKSTFTALHCKWHLFRFQKAIQKMKIEIDRIHGAFGRRYLVSKSDSENEDWNRNCKKYSLSINCKFQKVIQKMKIEILYRPNPPNNVLCEFQKAIQKMKIEIVVCIVLNRFLLLACFKKWFRK